MLIDMELYRVFFIVAEAGNISKASEQLYISQPAVSKSIMKLEELLNITLFIRSSRGVRLTNEGQVLFEHVKKAMSELKVGENILEKMKSNEYGIVKLSVSTTLTKHLLLPHLRTFIKANPHIKIQILNRSTFETLKLLDQGMIDFGLVSQPFEMEGYHYIKLIDIHDIFVAGKSYNKSYGLSHSHVALNEHPLMLLEEDNISRKYIDRYLVLNNLSVKPEIETGNMDILVEFAKLGLGITVLIKEFIEDELASKDLVQLPISPPIPPRSAGIIYRKEIPLSLASRSFIHHLSHHKPPENDAELPDPYKQ